MIKTMTSEDWTTDALRNRARARVVAIVGDVHESKVGRDLLLRPILVAQLDSLGHA